MPDPLRAKALSFLARREYSRAELEQKLMPLASSPEALQTLLDDLLARGQLSDARYAQSRIHTRGQRYGDLRLAQELRLAGVKEDVIAAALTGGEAEIQRCRRVWHKKFAILPQTPADKAKQGHFLRQRGFSPETIRQVLKNLDEYDE
jgi:regulatory protein